MDAKYRNKEWLTEQILINKRFYRDIGEECGVDKRTVITWAKKFGIKSPVRKVYTTENNPQTKVNPEELRGLIYERYVVRGVSVEDIANEIGVSKNPIYRIIRKYKMPKYDYTSKRQSEKQRKLIEIIRGINTRKGFVSHADLVEEGIYDSVKYYFDEPFQNLCKSLGVNYTFIRPKIFIELGNEFEEVLEGIFSELAYEYEAQKRFSTESGDLIPDFVFGSKWVDAKLSINAVDNCKNIGKYVKATPCVEVVYCVGPPRSISKLGDSVNCINVDEVISNIKEAQTRAFFSGKITDIRRRYALGWDIETKDVAV